MPVAFLFQAAGGSQEQYDAVMAAIGRSDLDAPSPAGNLSHVAGPVDDGWFVLDVWDSDEAAGRFYQSETFQSAVQANLPPVIPQRIDLHRTEIIEVTRQIA